MVPLMTMFCSLKQQRKRCFPVLLFKELNLSQNNKKYNKTGDDLSLI